MKLGTFVMGGLAGAAVVMMMQRNRTMSAIADGMGKMLNQRMNDVKENAMQKGIDLKFTNGLLGFSNNSRSGASNGNNNRSGASNGNHNGSGTSSANNHGGTSQQSSAKSNTSTEGLDQVEYMASKDPHVKHEVNEILHENGQHRI